MTWCQKVPLPSRRTPAEASRTSAQATTCQAQSLPPLTSAVKCGLWAPFLTRREGCGNWKDEKEDHGAKLPLSVVSRTLRAQRLRREFCLKTGSLINRSGGASRLPHLCWGWPWRGRSPNGSFLSLLTVVVRLERDEPTGSAQLPSSGRSRRADLEAAGRIDCRRGRRVGRLLRGLDDS